MNTDALLLDIYGEPVTVYSRPGVMESIATLNDQEQYVLSAYYVEGGGKRPTLKEIGLTCPRHGKPWGKPLLKQRIRQIKERALRKLRHPTRRKRWELPNA